MTDMLVSDNWVRYKVKKVRRNMNYGSVVVKGFMMFKIFALCIYLLISLYIYLASTILDERYSLQY